MLSDYLNTILHKCKLNLYTCAYFKALKNNESKFHILQISRLKLFTQITLSIFAFALPDIDMSMVLLFLIEENNNFRYKAICSIVED